jgi:hypothetical protein
MNLGHIPSSVPPFQGPQALGMQSGAAHQYSMEFQASLWSGVWNNARISYDFKYRAI